MAITPADFATFQGFVQDKAGKRELECRPYLRHAASLLIQQTYRGTIEHHEYRSNVGDADFILVADLVTDIGGGDKVAYLWELKAPQCYLFEYDDNIRRCRPTKDLVKAENQLLHYVAEAVGSDQTRQRLGVRSRTNIRPGGIIIGTQATMLRAATSRKDVALAEAALELRQEHFYRQDGIRVLLWDRILDAVRPSTKI